MTRPPKTAEVSGKVYKLVDDSSSLKERELLGECNNTTLIINYATHQAEMQLKDTVLHELLHAIDYAYQTGLKERQVHSLATGLLDLLRTNKKLTEWFLS